MLCYLNNRGLDVLAIVVSARRAEQDKIATLGHGADDYMSKPFSPMELMARILTVLRRRHPKSSHPSLVLTMVECELMQLLMQHPDQVITKLGIY
ncbi:response regulator transcription factor [Paenibacillus piri]|uniref:Response regulator transcription factor n=1 Tax=Paenibacillus piri TaxID=2547395 RepID=A0A4R5KL40_9BACL|nr:response regulator transcription factor [Paenibacillus piri]